MSCSTGRSRFEWPLACAILLVAFAAGGAVATDRPEQTAGAPISAQVSLEALVDTVRSGSSVGLWRRLIGRREPSQGFRPYAVAWQGEDLLVTDPATAHLFRMDRRGRIRSAARGFFGSPVGVATCNGVVLVTDSRAGDVSLLDRQLRLVRKLASGLARPSGIACDGRVVAIAETGRHRILTADAPTGAASEVPATTGWRALGRRGAARGEFNFPTAIALDGAAVWVGDTLNFRVQMLALATGEALGTFGALGDSPGEMPRIKGLAVDGRGRVWITDALLDRVALFKRDGTFLTAVGGRGREPGDLSFPAGLAAHADGRVAVADSFNQRIQIFRGPSVGPRQ